MTHGGPPTRPFAGGAASWLEAPAESGAPVEGGAGGAPGGALEGAPTGWTAPLRPGLVPLRPLQFGEVLSATFRLLRTNPGVTVGSSILVLAVSSILITLVTGLVSFAMFDRAASASPADRPSLELTAGVVTALTAIATSLLSLAGAALLQGVLTHVVARAVVAERATFAGAWRAAFRRAWPLIGYTAMVGGGTLVVIAGMYVLLLLPILLTGGQDDLAIGITVVLGMGFYVIVLVGVFALTVKLLFAAPAIVLEGLGPIAAMRRSWSLTRGHFWRLVGITLLVQTIAGFASGAVSAVVQVLLPLLLVIVIPLGVQAEGQEWIVIVVVLVFAFLALAAQVVVSALTLVLIAGNGVILYFDVRMRTEGLNLHLQRYREELAAGREPSDDPFTAPPIAPPLEQPTAGMHGAGMPGYGPPAYGPPVYGPPAYGPPAYGPPHFSPQPDPSPPHPTSSPPPGPQR